MDDTGPYWVYGSDSPRMDTTSTPYLTNDAKRAVAKDFVSKEEFSKYKEDIDTQLNVLKDRFGNSCYYNFKFFYDKGACSMLKKIRIVIVYGFAIFGLFTLVNDTILTNYKEELLRSYNCVTEYLKIHFHTAEHHAENWSSYSNEFKSKVWDSLSIHERINLTEIVNEYKQKTLAIKEFEKSF